MRLRVVSLPVSLAALLCLAVPAAHSQSNSVSFNLSTSKSFAPGEQPKIHLYTHNVDALEFRVYRVDDPVKFMENLRELHSFGPEASLLGNEQIDERTWLEKFHDWKADLWERHPRASSVDQLLRDAARQSLRAAELHPAEQPHRERG
jgi:hypothetical protein